MMIEYQTFIEQNGYNYEELLKKYGIKQEDVDLLREKTKNSIYVPKIMFDEHLIFFLNNTRDDIERASKWIHVYYKMKKNSPEFFKDRDPELPAIKKALDNQIFASFPATPQGNLVFYHGLFGYEPRNYNFDDDVKVFMMAAEAEMASKGPPPGGVLIFDLKGARFGHIFRPSLHSVKKGLEFLQVANPLDIKSIHVLNSFWFMDLVYAMIRPFLKQKFLDMIQLHPVGSTLEKLFEHDVPRSHVPKELGGDLPSTIRELHEKTRQLLKDWRDYFILEEKQANLEMDHLVNSEDYKYWQKYQ